MVIETHFPFKLIKLDELMPNVVLWRIKEDWGNIVNKAARKTKVWWSSKK